MKQNVEDPGVTRDPGPRSLPGNPTRGVRAPGSCPGSRLWRPRWWAARPRTWEGRWAGGTALGAAQKEHLLYWSLARRKVRLRPQPPAWSRPGEELGSRLLGQEVQRLWVPQRAWWPGARGFCSSLQRRPEAEAGPGPLLPNLGLPMCPCQPRPFWGPPACTLGLAAPGLRRSRSWEWSGPRLARGASGPVLGPGRFGQRRTQREGPRGPGSFRGLCGGGLGAIRVSAKKRGGVRATQARGARRPGDPVSSSTRVQFRPWRAPVSLLGHRQDVKASPGSF